MTVIAKMKMKTSQKGFLTESLIDQRDKERNQTGTPQVCIRMVTSTSTPNSMMSLLSLRQSGSKTHWASSCFNNITSIKI